MRAVPVPANDYPKWKNRVAWHLQSFCSRNDQWTPEQIEGQILARERQLWLAMDGDEIQGAVLTWVSADNLKSVSITHGAGENHRAWAPLVSVIEEWARDLGAKRLEVVARPGWERALPGMKKTHVVLEKAL